MAKKTTVEFTNYTDDDYQQMKRIEAKLVRTLVPFMANTPATLGLYVLIRMARTLLNHMPLQTRTELYPVLFAFLENRSVQPADGQAHRLLWTPGREN